MKKPTKLAASWMMQHKLGEVFKKLLNLMIWKEGFGKGRSLVVLSRKKIWQLPGEDLQCCNEDF